MAVVYVTQQPHKWDPATGALVPSVNIASAGVFGRIELLMPPQTSFQHTNGLIHQLSRALAPYDLEAGDCLLPLGDPVVTSCAIGILALRGPFLVLRWDRRQGKYEGIQIDMPMRRGLSRRSAIIF